MADIKDTDRIVCKHRKEINMATVSIRWSKEKEKRKKEVEEWRSIIVSMIGQDHFFGINPMFFYLEGNTAIFSNFQDDFPAVLVFNLSEPDGNYRFANTLEVLNKLRDLMTNCKHIWVDMAEFKNMFFAYADLKIPVVVNLEAYWSDLLGVHDDFPEEYL